MSTHSIREAWRWSLNLTKSGEFRAVREEPVGLIERACEGDGGAIEALVELYQDTIYSMAMTFTKNPHRAEDLAQEAWIRILKGLSGFRAGSRFSTWVYRVTMNTFLNSKRRKQLLVEAEVEELEQPSRVNSLARVDTAVTVQDAVRSLPHEFRAVVALRFVADLSYKEIAQVLDVPLGTVQSRLKRGLERLEQALSLDTDEQGRALVTE